jgi:hypothetical protein
MKKASLILLVLLLALFFGYVEGNAQEERLEGILPSGQTLLFSVLQTPDPATSEKSISAKSLNYIKTPSHPELTADDAEPTIEISVNKSSKSLDFVIAPVEHKNNGPVFPTIPVQTSRNPSNCTLSWQPLIL